MDTAFVGRVKALGTTSKGVEVDFEGYPGEEVARLAAFFLGNIGLALEAGTPFQGIYGRGSVAGRAIAGGLVNRQRYAVSVTPTADGGVHLSMESAMSGWSGSLLGLLREKRNRKQFAVQATAYFH